MFLDAHAMLGWTIGTVGGGDARVRRYVTLAAILPDLDALPVFLSADWYARIHHTFGHSFLLWALVSAFAYWRLRSWRATLLVFLAFGSHLLADAYLSGWRLSLFWPFSMRGYELPGAVNLGHPVNSYLFYVGLAAVGLLALVYRVTPISLFSVSLDQTLFRALERLAGSPKPAGAPPAAGDVKRGQAAGASESDCSPREKR